MASPCVSSRVGREALADVFGVLQPLRVLVHDDELTDLSSRLHEIHPCPVGVIRYAEPRQGGDGLVVVQRAGEELRRVAEEHEPLVRPPGGEPRPLGLLIQTGSFQRDRDLTGHGQEMLTLHLGERPIVAEAQPDRADHTPGGEQR